jgi:Family of unknown function (DUF6010)
MLPVIIGISSGLIIILLFIFLKQFDKRIIYGLILTGIGFIYIGFTWTDLQALVISSIQAIVFLFLAYYGITKSLYILAAGYILHGCWDIMYNFIAAPRLIPPQYDLFCLAIDFTMGIYILLLNKHFGSHKAF